MSCRTEKMDTNENHYQDTISNQFDTWWDNSSPTKTADPQIQHRRFQKWPRHCSKTKRKRDKCENTVLRSANIRIANEWINNLISTVNASARLNWRHLDLIVWCIIVMFCIQRIRSSPPNRRSQNTKIESAFEICPLVTKYEDLFHPERNENHRQRNENHRHEVVHF